jgi:hypothetical protein
MLNDKLSQLKQDLSEVNGAIEEVKGYDSKSLADGNIEETFEFKDLINKFSLLTEHLKDHIEDVEIFLGRV